MDFGFIRVGAAVPKVKVGDTTYNSGNIIELIKKAEKHKLHFIVFPECCVTAYTCADLFHQRVLLEGTYKALELIIDASVGNDMVAIIGAPIELEGRLYNTAIAISNGKILGIVPKSNLPNYNEFYEKRWFSSGAGETNRTVVFLGQEVPFGTDILFCDNLGKGINFGLEICEDLWVPIPPSSKQACAGALLLFNLSASNELIGKFEYRRNIIATQASKCAAAYVYASSGSGESSTDLVFGGHALISEYGNVMAELERFEEESGLIFADVDFERLLTERKKNEGFSNATDSGDYRKISYKVAEHELDKLHRNIDPHPFVPANDSKRDQRCSEIFAIQTCALATRYKATGSKNAIIGISGGLDSTLALLVTAKTFDRLKLERNNIIAVTMPGFGTTDGTYKNSVDLIKAIGARFVEIDIKAACLKHFEDIGHDPNVHNVTFENVQARERTQILMDIANKEGGLVIGTGDLSELALGWCTYNGDHISMYNVNCGIPKTLVKYMVSWVAENNSDKNTARILKDILDTPISPELVPPSKSGKITQKTEEIIGAYELHDFFIYNCLRFGYSPSKVLFLAEIAFKGKYDKSEIVRCLRIFIKRFFSQQFKRSCVPDGPKVGTISLSPRGDWRMPSDACAEIWLKDLDK